MRRLTVRRSPAVSSPTPRGSSRWQCTPAGPAQYRRPSHSPTIFPRRTSSTSIARFAPL
jgi:hypothetical protein